MGQQQGQQGNRRLDPQALRRRVVVPAAKRVGLDGIGLHTIRHTCASLLIAEGASMLRLQRWMGHHSPAYTLEAYGHLIDGELGDALELSHLDGTNKPTPLVSPALPRSGGSLDGFS